MRKLRSIFLGLCLCSPPLSAEVQSTKIINYGNTSFLNNNADESSSVMRSSVIVNTEIPLQQIKELANKGDAQAKYTLANVFYQGLGIKQNLSAAAYWFNQAADNGVLAAQCTLAYMYSTGKGVTANKNKAFSLYQNAAAKNY